MPPRAAGTGRGSGWRGAVHRAFVEYNPLYFASALSILGGVFLLARELPMDAFGSKAGIVASTEAYQFLLIAGAAILLRASLKRPAAILGLVSLVFLLDVAMNGERLLSHVGLLSLAPGMRARRAVPVSVLLALLGPVKLWLLASVFKLRSAKPTLLVVGLALLILPLLPYLTELVAPPRRDAAYLVITWLGAPLLAWACSPAARRWTSAWAGESPDPRVRQIVLVAPMLVAALFIAHGLMWSFVASLPLVPAIAAPYLLALSALAAARFSVTRPRVAEFIAWGGTASALGTATQGGAAPDLWPVAAILLLAGAVMVYLVEAKGLRVFLLAAGGLFGGAWIAATGLPGPVTLPGAVWPAGFAVALLAGAIRHRDFRSLVASALSAGAAVAAVRPGETLTAYGGLVAGLWLAAGCWMVFPTLRRWVPIAATAGLLALGTWMLWRDLPGIGLGYAGLAVAAAGFGIAFRRPEFQGVGAAGGSVLAVFKHAAWIPSTSIGWGFLLLGAGFLLLSAGVAVNLLLARGRARAAGPALTPPAAPAQGGP